METIGIIVVGVKTASTCFTLQSVQDGGQVLYWPCLAGLASKPLHHAIPDYIPHLFVDLRWRVGKGWDAFSGIVECGAPPRVLVAQLLKSMALGYGDAKSALHLCLHGVEGMQQKWVPRYIGAGCRGKVGCCQPSTIEEGPFSEAHKGSRPPPSPQCFPWRGKAASSARFPGCVLLRKH